ncbi:MAG TPA: tetratricopeptide repeat protein, partial [Pyrinomonadaceae bacterium]|nr:tetratricopeptide repeat protein [Pyrinomonadaceae bacterium]
MDKPSVITTRKPLPFGDLSPLEFERMSLWLVEREGYVRAQHLGETGSEQGRDVVAYRPTDGGEELWYFQCKRYNRIDAATLKKEVDKYDALALAHPERRPHGIVFVTNASVSANVRDDVERYCQQHGYAYDFWARNELDMRVKRHPDIVAEFFDAGRGLASPVAPPALHQLPSPPRDFTGREKELRELLSGIEQGGATILCLRGMGGIGKTALALKLAAQLAPRYPDAQFYLDLKGASAQPLSAADAMLHVVRAYDPTARPPDSDAELSARYMSLLHGRRALLLMDNAAGREQVEPLIPPDTCLLLVTSRRRFSLPGLFDKDLDRLSPDEARALLLKIAPRIAEHADEIARLCGQLPLALRLAASALAERKDLSASDYARRLNDTRKRLELVEASLTLSYDLLTPDLQKLWRILAVFPDTFAIEAAASVWVMEQDDAQDSLSELVKYSILEWDEDTSRYGLHDLARLFADSRLSDEGRDDGRRRHASHYMKILWAADQLYKQGGAGLKRGIALFDSEWPNIRAGQSWAGGGASGDDAAARLYVSYSSFGALLFDLRMHPQERIRGWEAAIAAARRLKDRAAEGALLNVLGTAYFDSGDARRAVECYEQSLVIAREFGNSRSEVDALGNLGNAYVALNAPRRAIEYCEQALALARELGDRSLEGSIQGVLGNAYDALG